MPEREFKKQISIEEEKGELSLEKIRSMVGQNAERVAELGEWPEYIEPGSLLERVPQEGEDNAPGFDAGVACALDLIPRDKQKLAATLHANYTKDAVMQVREELKEMNPDSETIWWLAACSVCKEGGINEERFMQQIKDFKELSADDGERKKSAEGEFEKMTSAYTLKYDGVPYGEQDGCIQGAYIDGYSFGVMYAENYGIYFIGTYEDSLGLEDFDWSDEKDEEGRAKSGPVFGSKQFVKCANEEELKRALGVVKENLPLKEKAEE